jgi:hypothetical protein
MPVTAAMENSLAWQQVIEDQSGDNQEFQAHLREISHWFPSTQMLVNHTRGLIRVMMEAELDRTFPGGVRVPPAVILVWVMHETKSICPCQCTRWCMYHSAMQPMKPDPHRSASQAECVHDTIIALRAHDNGPQL